MADAWSAASLGLVVTMMLMAGCAGPTGPDASIGPVDVDEAARLRTESMEAMGPGGDAREVRMDISLDMEGNGESVRSDGTGVLTIHQGDALRMVMDMTMTGNGEESEYSMVMTCQDGEMRMRTTMDGEDMGTQEMPNQEPTCLPGDTSAGLGSLMWGNAGLPAMDPATPYDSVEVQGQTVVATYSLDEGGMVLSGTDRFRGGRMVASDMQMTMDLGDGGEEGMRMEADISMTIEYGTRSAFGGHA